MSDSISRWGMARLCFHLRYRPMRSGKTAAHALSALQWHTSREQVRYKCFVLPPKALQYDQLHGRKGGGRRGKAHNIMVCNLVTTFPSGHVFSSQMSTHSSSCGSMSIGSMWLEVLGIISQSIALGSQFAAIPNSAIFWHMIVDRPVVNKSTICVLGKKSVVETYNASFLQAASFPYEYVKPSQPSSYQLLYPIVGQ